MKKLWILLLPLVLGEFEAPAHAQLAGCMLTESTGSRDVSTRLAPFSENTFVFVRAVAGGGGGGTIEVTLFRDNEPIATSGPRRGTDTAARAAAILIGDSKEHTLRALGAESGAALNYVTLTVGIGMNCPNQSP